MIQRSSKSYSELVVLDVLVLVLSAYIAYFFRFNEFSAPLDYDNLILINGFCYFVLSSISGANRIDATMKFRSALNSVGTLCVAFSVLLGYLFFSKTSEEFSRLWISYWFSISLVAVFIARLVAGRFVQYRITKGQGQKRILVIGEPSIVALVAERLSLGKQAGMIKHQVEINCRDATSLPSSSVLEEMVLEHKISETWICLSFKEEESYTRVLFNLRNTTCDILRIPSANDLILMDRKVSIVDGLQLIDISCLRQNGIDRFMKAAEDYTVASLSILLLSPMIVVICLLVKFSSPGPIFFKQYRHGLDGKRFKVYKFRTMVVHDEADGKTTQAVKGDSRVTPIGSILRRSSLDELPQLMNVLQGRMSIVGPRPHALDHNYHFKDLIDSYMRRHIVKPGLTGWAQIHGFRGETDTIDKMRKRVELDLYYIENWSLVLDVKILLLTPWKLLVDSNAY